MKKIKMARGTTLTFEEGCNKYVVYVNVTKNRKPLIVPLNQTMVSILDEYLKYRHHKSNDDYLFCNSFGQQLVKGTRLTTKKSLECKAIIHKHSKDFGGSLEDPDVIKLCGCSRNSYYKYKREIRNSLY